MIKVFFLHVFLCAIKAMSMPKIEPYEPISIVMPLNNNAGPELFLFAIRNTSENKPNYKLIDGSTDKYVLDNGDCMAYYISAEVVTQADKDKVLANEKRIAEEIVELAKKGDVFKTTSFGLTSGFDVYKGLIKKESKVDCKNLTFTAKKVIIPGVKFDVYTLTYDSGLDIDSSITSKLVLYASKSGDKFTSVGLLPPTKSILGVDAAGLLDILADKRVVDDVISFIKSKGGLGVGVWIAIVCGILVLVGAGIAGIYFATKRDSDEQPELHDKLV
eukprot:GAHX01000086.1.p1 GENE.GAHX01000086.1~~GAHX01000086.1.p1  ORF type:complete len:291 (+),score=62.33 GAHX01000086.1:53-874(+)